MTTRQKRYVEKVVEACPNKDAHTACPEGYLEWHFWADEMAKTHDQQICSGCNRWAIWTPATNLCEHCDHPVSMHDHEPVGECALPDCGCVRAANIQEGG